MPRVPAVDPSPDEVLVKAELDDLVPEALRGGPLATALRISPRQTNGAGSSSSNRGSNGGSNGSGNGSSNGSVQRSRGRQLPPFKQGCPPLLIGGNGLGEGMYHSDDVIRGLEPYRMFRLALEYGMNAIDTSPYYHPSEIRLGRILRTLAPQFPRHSYYLCTKAGRNGPDKGDFDYRAQSVRRSVERSCQRMETAYLDVVLMHDVEFVAESVGPAQAAGFAARDLIAETDDDGPVHTACGLAPVQAGKSFGQGDDSILEAVAELFRLKDEGIVDNVGISGYPLPTLLRLSRLVFARLHRPLDVVLSYSHHTLQSDLLVAYLDHFQRCPLLSEEHTWDPPRVLNASPFSMGLLTDDGPPAWHPAPVKLKNACTNAAKALQQASTLSPANQVPSLTQTAARFGMRGAEVARPNAAGQALLPTLVGMRDVEQVHAAVDAYRVLLAGAQAAAAAAVASHSDDNGRRPRPLVGEDAGVERDAAAYRRYEAQERAEAMVRDELHRAGFQHWSWASPGGDA